MESPEDGWEEKLFLGKERDRRQQAVGPASGTSTHAGHDEVERDMFGLEGAFHKEAVEWCRTSEPVDGTNKAAGSGFVKRKILNCLI
jgi:hypothetical protein